MRLQFCNWKDKYSVIMTYELDVMFIWTHVSQLLSYKWVVIYTTQGLALWLETAAKGGDQIYGDIWQKLTCWQTVVDAYKHQQVLLPVFLLWLLSV